MGDFQRIQFDANGDEVTPEQGKPHGEAAFFPAATVRDINAENAAAREALDHFKDERILNLSDQFDAKRAQIEELDDIIAVHQRGGQKAPRPMLERVERMRHDLMIMHAELTDYVNKNP